jgi:hypothetical protein
MKLAVRFALQGAPSKLCLGGGALIARPTYPRGDFSSSEDPSAATIAIVTS